MFRSVTRPQQEEFAEKEDTFVSKQTVSRITSSA